MSACVQKSLGWLLTSISFLWGVIIFLSILCDSFSKFMAVRFFLGAAEAW